jgi:hypothetical protein
MHGAAAQHSLAANETRQVPVPRPPGDSREILVLVVRACLAFIFHFAFSTFERLKSFLKCFYLHASSILAFSLEQIL